MRKTAKAVVTGATAIWFLATPAQAQDDPVADILSCDPLTSPRERLACYDAVAKQFKVKRYGAAAARESAPRALPADRPGAVARPEVRSASLPDLPARSDVRNPDAGIGSARITRFWVDERTGTTYVRLDNGQVWQDTDGQKLRLRDRHVGAAVEISKGALGGYRMKVAGKSGKAWVKPVER